MNANTMEKLTRHFDTYFHQSDSAVLHPIVMDPHIDALLYPPNEAYPYWKLVTMGASDYKMSAPAYAIGNRNEYMMFIDPDEDMNNTETANWYFSKLMEVALFPVSTKSFISYGHSVEWKPDEGEEMVCAFIELPQLVDDTGILMCKLGLAKTAVCLQVILLNREETDRLLNIGPQQFSEFIYPEQGQAHFICERNRSEKF